MERAQLSTYHIDPLFLWMFVFGKPIEFALMLTGLTNTPSVYALIIYGGYLLASLVIAKVIWELASNSNLQYRYSMPWVGVGVVIGLVCGTLSGFIISQQLVMSTISTSFGSVLVLIIQQTSFAGLAEEPLFRGFLWGYLKKAGWTENRILVYQAILFLVAHLQYLFVGYWRSLILTFLLGLVFGWLVKQSRAISTTVVAHGLINGMGQIIASLIGTR